MNRSFLILLGAGLLTFASGCRGGGYPIGVLYNATTMPHELDKAEVAGAPKSGDRSGEACATGILGLVAFGDASIDAAKKNGQIKEVHSVEYKPTAVVLGAYFSACTVIHGQ